MPDFTLRVLTFIKVSSSDCLLTRRRLRAGDNTGHGRPAGPQRRLKIIRPRENRKAARGGGGTQPGWWRAQRVGSGVAASASRAQESGRVGPAMLCPAGERSCCRASLRRAEAPHLGPASPPCRSEPPAGIILRGGRGAGKLHTVRSWVQF